MRGAMKPINGMFGRMFKVFVTAVFLAPTLAAACFVFLTFVGSGTAHALTYVYTGEPYTAGLTETTSGSESEIVPSLGGSMTASVTFDRTVTPSFTGSVSAAHILSWRITSGPYTLTQNTSGAVLGPVDPFNPNPIFFRFEAGAILGWLLEAAVPGPTGLVEVQGGWHPLFYTSYGDTRGNPGYDGEDGVLVNTPILFEFNRNLGSPGDWQQSQERPCRSEPRF